MLKKHFLGVSLLRPFQRIMSASLCVCFLVLQNPSLLLRHDWLCGPLVILSLCAAYPVLKQAKWWVWGRAHSPDNMRGSRCVDTHELTSHLISLELLSYPLLLIILNLGYVNMQSQDMATCFFPKPNFVWCWCRHKPGSSAKLSSVFPWARIAWNVASLFFCCIWWLSLNFFLLL